MKFGLFYEMYVPPDDIKDPGAEARIIRETVDQIVYADQLGWDYVWLTEHHFLRQFSHMSAAEVLFGAAVYATEHIRFGFGLTLTPPKYNHPVRIAERVAMLDCLSNGRVDLGTGRSTTPAELYGFDIDPAESREMWEEGLEAVARLLAYEDVALDGKYVKMPPRTSLPRPVQKPHPPLWVGGVGPGNAERAAKPWTWHAVLRHQYGSRGSGRVHCRVSCQYREREPYVGGVNNQVAGFVNLLCAEPEKRDEVRWLAATKMVEHTRHGSHFMTTGWPDPENIPPSYAHVMQGDTMDFKTAIEADPDGVAQGLLDSGMVAAGTPDDLLEVLQRFKDVGVDQVIVHMQMGGVPHDAIMKTIELMGKEVLPKLRS